MTDSDKLFERFGREFPPGTVIFKEGDVGNEMYVIQSGKINITKSSRDQEKLLVTLGPGAFFGEMAIINNSPGRPARWWRRAPGCWSSGPKPSMP
jgi:CRP-like cAMP-binding protein